MVIFDLVIGGKKKKNTSTFSSVHNICFLIFFPVQNFSMVNPSGSFLRIVFPTLKNFK